MNNLIKDIKELYKQGMSLRTILRTVKDIYKKCDCMHYDTDTCPPSMVDEMREFWDTHQIEPTGVVKTTQQQLGPTTVTFMHKTKS